MQPVEIILIGILGGGILTALATIFVVKWRQTHIAWKPLPSRSGVWYCFESTGSVQKLTEAIDLAVEALAEHSPWTRVQIEYAIDDLHIHVKAAEHWAEDTGQGPFQTAGLQMDNGVRVGCSFAALCHEIAHRVEQVVDHRIDFTHAGWTANGIFAAIEAYGAALSRTLQP